MTLRHNDDVSCLDHVIEIDFYRIGVGFIEIIDLHHVICMFSILKAS
jgi:hypothetical protein